MTNQMAEGKDGGGTQGTLRGIHTVAPYCPFSSPRFGAVCASLRTVLPGFWETQIWMNEVDYSNKVV